MSRLPVRITAALCALVTVIAVGPGAVRPAGAAGPTGWQQVQPTLTPLQRARAATAYDSARGVTVVFGGWDGSTFLNDTWEYDGTTWTKRSTANSPSPRAGAFMAYDPAEGRTVLFGGMVGTGPGMNAFVNDTWVWDGTNWTSRATPTAPSPRAFGAFAADTGRSRLVLFGGALDWCDETNDAPDCPDVFASDTWEWNGAGWTQVHPAASPSARAFVSAAYDQSRARTVTFGGVVGDDTLADDTWEFNGTTWLRVAATGPGLRYSYGLAYDSARSRSVLFGGCQQGSANGATWEWDGTSWASPSYGTPPPNRADAAFAYDQQRGRIVLMGGFVTTTCDPLPAPTGDTWEIGQSTAGAATGLTVTVTEPSVTAGASNVSLGAVPGTRLNQMVESASVAPVGTVPVGGIQLGSIQLGSIQMGSIQLGSIQLGSIQLGSIQMGSIQLGSIQLGSIPAGGLTLDSIQLGSIPTVDWNAILQGSSLQGQLLQTLSLQQVLNDPVAAPRFNALTLAQVGLANTVLRTMPVGDILVGNGPLDNLPPPTGFATWCTFWQSTGWPPASSCSDSARGGAAGANIDPSKTSLIGMDVAGAPTQSATVGGIQLGSIANPSATALYGMRLQGININATQLGSIPVNQLPNPGSVVDCTRVDCSATSTQTLGYAASLSPTAVQPGATVGSMCVTTGGQTTCPLLSSVTVGDVVAGLLPLNGLNWEKLAVDGIQDVAPVTPAGVHYAVSFDVPCGAAAPHLNVQVTPPVGFRYMAGTSRVVAGGANLALPDPAGSNPPLADTVDTLAWSALPVACSGQTTGSQHWALTFQMQPGLDIGTYTASATVSTPAVTTVTGQAPLHVNENWEPNTDPLSAPVISADTLVVGHIAGPNDPAYFRIPVPAEGTRTTVSLSHITPGADFDLAILRPATPSIASTQLGSIQLGSIAIEDRGYGTGSSTASVPPETLQDIQLGSIPVNGGNTGSLTVASLSQTRGNADESTSVTTGPETGYYTIAVSGYNGSYSNRPFVLRVQQSPPPGVPATPALTLTLPAPGTLVPAGVQPGSTTTLFVMDEQRMKALYSAGRVTAMETALNQVATMVNGPTPGGWPAGAPNPGVLFVDGDSASRAAFAAWDATPASVDASNDVVRKVNTLLAGYRAALPNLHYIVTIGSHQALPMAAVPDNGTVSNERSYINDLAFTLSNSGVTQGNALYALEALGFYLTDDAYTTGATVPFQGGEIFLPSVSGGRLLETPEEIQGQLSAYSASGGVLNPRTAATSGYDFLSDGATAINSGLGARLGSANADGSLISNTWTKQNLLARMVPTGAASPDIISPNAHANHFQLEPAAAAATGSFTSADILSVGDLPQAGAGATQFGGRVLFSMGCHAGLNVPDTLLASPTSGQATGLHDWAQYYAQQQAAVYVANTGYGYGDTATVGLSERLLSLFAQNFADDSLSIGDKLVKAKAQYYKTAGTYDVYDVKVLEEATLYGLPFYRTGGSSTVTPPTPPATHTDAVTGLQTATLPFTPSLTRTDTPRGTFWSASGGSTQQAIYRPIEPRVDQDVTVPGTTAHGAIITSFATGDVTGITPALALPTIDLTAHEPAPNFVDQLFPAGVVKLTGTTVLGKADQLLTLAAGQYRGGGVQRLVNSAGVDVAYSTSSDFSAPFVTNVAAVRNGASATLYVTAVKTAGAAVKRVGVLYNDNGTWKFVDLANLGGNSWSATVTLSVAQDFEMFAEGQDAAGNVGYSTNKGFDFHPLIAAPPAGVTLTAPSGLNQITLSWQPSTGGAPITSYRVYRGTSPSNLTLLATVSGSTMSYTDTGLANGTTYTYAVSAVSNAGEGPLSNYATATTFVAPSAPIGLTGTAGSGGVALGWQAPQSDGGSPITGYRVYRALAGPNPAFAQVAQTPPSPTAYTDTGATSGTAFLYFVTAVNVAGESVASNTVSVTTVAPPGAPQNLQARAPLLPLGATVLKWQGPASNGGAPLTAYKVYRTDSRGTVTVVTVADATGGPPPTTYTARGLSLIAAYRYRVTAVNAAGLEGPPSNVVCAIPSPLGLILSCGS